jgi:hypothetical protein
MNSTYLKGLGMITSQRCCGNERDQIIIIKIRDHTRLKRIRKMKEILKKIVDPRRSRQFYVVVNSPCGQGKPPLDQDTLFDTRQ